ncbi:hypothetical protein CVIRNUC_008041 [Coccomyxa viridis]|uniref:Glutaredoxin domain-containing protein n=1 Tax=Coccomyxa viridis TaxID=1274662 RepID=A0AAV1IDP9_9CHLO|nr:hypothetical protein CVIRNUC_008041 [Coccomyxa viridis]
MKAVAGCSGVRAERRLCHKAFNPLLGATCLPSCASRPSSRSRTKVVVMAADNGSSKGSPLEGAINALSVTVTNFQPLNNGKKWLAKMQAGDYSEADINAKLDQYIQKSPVVVFSWSRCPFCVKAKSALKSMDANFVAVELDQMPEGAAMRAELAKRTNRTSMPNIWVRQQSIGGCNDGPGLLTLERSGKLRPMLQSAGAL